MKSNFLHRGLRFGILHEGVPNEAAAVVFRHQHGDAEIDAQHVRVVPTGQRIEGVDEPVLLPHLIPVRTAEISQDSHAIVEEERQRAAGRAKRDKKVCGPWSPSRNSQNNPRRRRACSENRTTRANTDA